MNILQVVSLGYAAGGAEKSVVLLRDALQKRGHTVTIMASDRDPDKPNFADYTCRHIQGGPFRHLWSGSAYRTLQRALAECKPDIVHFHTMGELSPSVLFALGKTPAVLTVHGPEEYTLSLLEWYLSPAAFNGSVSVQNLTMLGRLHYWFFGYLQRPLYKVGFRKLQQIIAPSKYMAAQLAKEGYDVPVQQIYNGIPLPRQRLLPTGSVVLYVGRLEHVKGVEVLLRAMPEVIAQVPAATLRVVGDGPDRPRLEKLAADLGLAQSVTFVGWQQDVMAEYKNARLLAVPSIWPENLPTVVMEALAVGRPVVGTRVGGIPELVQDGTMGAIVAPNDPEALATAIIVQLTNANLQQTANAAAQSADRFAIGRFIDQIEQVYAGNIR